MKTLRTKSQIKSFEFQVANFEFYLSSVLHHYGVPWEAHALAYFEFWVECLEFWDEEKRNLLHDLLFTNLINCTIYFQLIALQSINRRLNIPIASALMREVCGEWTLCFSHFLSVPEIRNYREPCMILLCIKLRYACAHDLSCMLYQSIMSSKNYHSMHFLEHNYKDA